ncbi:DUF4179 domain-containing protein [Paenibacillus zeisoli]|uniref:DUF4179 domain-containing protein n=1 Tax=Paenibacillus zeisoli TaxID=2496267 RepID=A0A433XCT2_9BACL|nr:DUF4179 domain-containing protein [Paenibacillus zeisoli]RUT31961.1 DUF4179 domain-containing protein [Paenibacillus zeisoli]
MNRREEQRLIDYFQSSHIAEQSIEDTLLDKAVVQGIQMGSRKRRSFMFRYRAGIMAGTLALCIGLFILMWPRIHVGPSPAADKVNFTAPDYVKSQISHNSAWLEAANHGLYQPINQTREQGGYRVTVDGVLADKRTMIFFYTAENMDGSSTPAVNNTKFLGTDGKSVSASVESDSFSQLSNKKVVQNRYILNFYGNDTTPDKFTFTGNWGPGQASDAKRQKFEIPVKLDRSKFINLEKHIPVHQDMMIHGLKATLDDATLYPLSTELGFSYDKKNSRKIQQFIKPRLTLKLQDQAVESAFRGSSLTENEPNRMYFNSLYYTDFSSLQFRSDGVEESLGDHLSIVVDTSKRELVHAPDDRVRLGNVITDSGSTEIQFHIKRGSNSLSSLDLDYSFTDGKGHTHKVATTRSESRILDPYSSHSSNDDFDVYHYFIDTKSYPQPLTIPITNYPGNEIRQPITIPIQ